MKRLSVLCLLVAGIMYSTATHARICFLGDLDCQDGKFAVDETIQCRNQSSEWVHENNLCKGLVYGSPVCNDSTGNYYREGSCPSGYTDIANLGDKYDCVSSLLCNKCCANEDVKCKERYQICDYNSEGVPGDTCTESNEEGTEVTKYGRCECNKNIYSLDCVGVGVEGDYSDTCIDSDGKTWFKSCQCSAGYSRTSFGNIKCSDECNDNCRIGSYGKLLGTEDYCWEGAECLDDSSPIGQCVEPQQSDFDTFWGGYDVAGECKNLTVDCAALGYNTGEAGSGAKCVGGTEPYRCPFDHTKVYCERGIAGVCSFYTKEDCELSYFGSVCVAGSSQCYSPSVCKTGYVKSIEECATTDEGIYSLGQADEFGCAACVCQNTCQNEVEVIPENAKIITESCTSCGQTQDIIIGYECNEGYQKDAEGQCVKISCNVGDVTDVKDCGQEGGWELGTTPDAGGCYSCIMKSCPEGSSINKDQQCMIGQSLREVGYSGDNVCYQCLGCSDGYAADVKYCGSMGSDGWILEGEADSLGCKKCTIRQCPEGSSTSPCGTAMVGVENGFYSGNSPCIQCQTCSENYATNVEFCGPAGSRGWMLSTDKDTIGCNKCTAKACPEDSEVNKICQAGQNRVTAGYSGDRLCYRCEGEPTPILTCESAGCVKGQYLCGDKCTNYANSPECTYCTGSSSEGGSSTGGGSSCDPLMMTECEYKICVDSNYCVTGAGSGGMDPMCCEIDEEEGSVGGLDPEKPFG